MKLQLNQTNRAILAAVGLLVLAILFWTQLLSPKREEADKLGKEAAGLRSSLAQHEAEIAEAEAAKGEFAEQYQRLVVVGKAVPGDDDVASLLVQVNRISEDAKGVFRDIVLSSSGGGEAPEPAPAAGAGEPASPTEVAAALLPLGATIGPAGLAVMPYDVTYTGSFFGVADFIKGIDSLVDTKDEEGVVVDGRLVTIDGFSLVTDKAKGFPTLEASFALTTYLTPPDQGITGGATPESPPGAAPVATTTGALP